MIKVYSLPNCGGCQKAKKYLKSLNLEYKDINIEMDDQAGDEMEEISDQDSTPVIVINDSVIVGFNKDAIDKALGINLN